MDDYDDLDALADAVVERADAERSDPTLPTLCRHCGRSIVHRFTSDSVGLWRHAVVEGWIACDPSAQGAARTVAEP